MKTVKEFRAAVKAATKVVVMPRFGLSEAWVGITKADALGLVKGAKGDATAEEFSMFTGEFGSVTDGVLYIG
jgi:hypothetical protein